VYYTVMKIECPGFITRFKKPTDLNLSRRPS
ncbi:unnamed protein product, partial [marine sediment metagenome]